MKSEGLAECAQHRHRMAQSPITEPGLARWALVRSGHCQAQLSSGSQQELCSGTHSHHFQSSMFTSKTCWRHRRLEWSKISQGYRPRPQVWGFLQLAVRMCADLGTVPADCLADKEEQGTKSGKGMGSSFSGFQHARRSPLRKHL